MYISVARKKLQTVLAAATDPSEIAMIVGQLAKLLDAEGRERGRKRRARAKKQATAKLEAPTIDLDEEFDFTPAGRADQLGCGNKLVPSRDKVFVESSLNLR